MNGRDKTKPEAGWPARVRPQSLVAGGLVVATVGLGLLAIGLLNDTARTWFAFLVAVTFATTVCIGGLILLMVGHTAKASWMVVTRRPSEAIVSALPLCAILWIVLAFGIRRIYPWAAPTASLSPAVLHAVEHKRVYLNPPFFIARSVLYFAFLLTVGRLLRVWSLENDIRPSLHLVRRMRRLSGGALPVLSLILTWASFDWTMSLEPAWHSTIFGLYYFAGAFVGAIALVAVILPVSSVRLAPHLRPTPEHGQALGRVLFAMVIFWAYMAFSELLIIWIADLPSETTYYRLRTTGTWTAVTTLLVVGHFFAPFFALLNRRLKRRMRALVAVSVWLFVMHFVDVYWMIMPVHDVGGVRPHWIDAAGVFFVGGLFSAWIAREYARAAPLPSNVPDLAQGIRYEAAS